ncbi:transporter substrate-binding domain-containing protein [Winogradskya humida]|uniref:Glutamate-binding protein n=1 Tax=Winogradskya humida TaxID=113566 RepID=A0ABQ3ZHL2_9ACTN|nr:transporter substrate-binding domain-containing protein [Actinoplanes humidus]GIE18065.1 glutamate-binding protein [Actinoplanes humidus]
MSLTLLITLLIVAACENATHVPPPSVEDKMVEAGLRDPNRSPKLRIGVYTWQRTMGYTERGVNKGFDVEVARYIARNLGYEGDDKIDWVPLSSIADRMKVLEAKTVDMVVASFSINADRAKSIGFAGPYLLTEQSVLIPAALKGRIATIGDLKKPAYEVCTSTGSTSEALLNERRIPVTPLNSDRDCFKGLRDGTFQAMSSDRTVLAGFAAEYPRKFELPAIQLTTLGNPGIEELGIGVAKDNVALRELIDYFLYKSYRDQQAGRSTEWQRAYRQYLSHLGPASQPAPAQVPDLLDYDAKSPGR